MRLTHRGFSYKFWANTLVMAHTANDVIFADYPMFHIAGFFGRGIMAIADGMEIVIPAPGGARDKRFIENYWKFVEKFRISILSGVPTTLAQLSKQPTGGADLSFASPLRRDRIDRVPGRDRAPARKDLRRAHDGELWRHRIHPERRAAAARRRSALRLGRTSPALHADQDRRHRRRRPHHARARRRPDRPRGGEGPERHAGLCRRGGQQGHPAAGRLVQLRRSRAHRRRRLSLDHRPRQGHHHPRRPQHRPDGDRGDAAQASAGGARGGGEHAGCLCGRVAGRLCRAGAERHGDGGRGAGVRRSPTARNARPRRSRSSCSTRCR